MPDKGKLTFAEVFLALFAAARGLQNKSDVTDDLDQAESDARAFVARLEEIDNG